MSDHETAADVETSAVTWLWKRQSTEWTANNEAEFQAWLGGSTARAGAFLRAEAAWASLDRLAWQDAPEAPRRALDRQGLTRRAVWGMGVAAAASLVAGIGYWASADRYESPKTDIRPVDLRDGSQAILDAATALQVRLGAHARHITLARGEAFFQVKPDRTRPFVVAAGRLRVQAVGTAFSVSVRDGASHVVVTEGVVETWFTDKPRLRTRLRAGQLARIVQAQDLVAVQPTPVSGDHLLAWRYRKIDLDGETLAEAVDRFNRYNSLQITVVDPAAARRRLYGVFNSDDPKAFARTAALSLGVPATIGDDHIEIGAIEP